jgi:hypothetical protein
LRDISLILFRARKGNSKARKKGIWILKGKHERMREGQKKEGKDGHLTFGHELTTLDWEWEERNSSSVQMQR